MLFDYVFDEDVLFNNLYLNYVLMMYFVFELCFCKLFWN